jgi:hypothetical protein
MPRETPGRKKVVPREPLAVTRADFPPLRELTIIAQDPSIRLGRRIVTTLASIAGEPLHPGPCGARIKVVDYDVSADRLYLPRKSGYQTGNGWSDPYAGAMSAEQVGDPGFHQQNVYAIAMRVLGQFESALGRRANFAFQGHQLHIAPHAFAEANAYYSREDRSLFFGYFPDARGRPLYTCLSHDVVAHEMTHALLDGLRPGYINPSSPDQAGFHEGFADLVALLTVLSQRDVVEAVLAAGGVLESRRKLVDLNRLDVTGLEQSALLGLAEQMGQTVPNGVATALRRSVTRVPNPRWRDDPDFEEPHECGELLVAPIMQAFVAVWHARNAGLRSTGGGMVDGMRVVEEGATAAQHLLTMCLRALDYAPPTDLQFGDYLSALLTADRETVPNDARYGYREKVRAAFARWGILPASDPQGDGCWTPFRGKVSHRNIRFAELQRQPEEAFRFLWENFDTLKLSHQGYTQVQGVRLVARVAPDGLIVRETVVDYVQVRTVRGRELESMGLVRPPEVHPDRLLHIYGGGVLVFDEFGQLKYSIGNNVANTARQQPRLDFLARSGFFEFASDEAFSLRYFARLHMQRAQKGFAL